MNKTNLEEIEINLLLTAVKDRYGYDFQQYERESIKRRIKYFLQSTNHKHISQIIPGILHNENILNSFIYSLSVPFTEMFRDPLFFHILRNKIFPELNKNPYLKIWHAGCASGEEVYSTAILLKEEGLYEKSIIFATDFNDSALKQAKKAVYNLKDMQKYTKNYINSGCKDSFSTYYLADYDAAVLDSSLREKIIFANHNLVTDDCFGEMHMIFCRNVMIYFNNVLKEKVFLLLNQSLLTGGYLCLGTKESLQFSNIYKNYSIVDKEYKIYKKEK